MVISHIWTNPCTCQSSPPWVITSFPRGNRGSKNNDNILAQHCLVPVNVDVYYARLSCSAHSWEPGKKEKGPVSGLQAGLPALPHNPAEEGQGLHLILKRKKLASKWKVPYSWEKNNVILLAEGSEGGKTNSNL